MKNLFIDDYSFCVKKGNMTNEEWLLVIDYLNKLNNGKDNVKLSGGENMNYFGIDKNKNLCAYPNSNIFNHEIDLTEFDFDKLFYIPNDFYVKYSDKINQEEWLLFIEWLNNLTGKNFTGTKIDSTRVYGRSDGCGHCNRSRWKDRELNFDRLYRYILKENENNKPIQIPRSVLKFVYEKETNEVNKKIILHHSKRNVFENYIETTLKEVNNDVFFKLYYKTMLELK